MAEALTMVAAQVMTGAVAVDLGGAGGYPQSNACKPLAVFDITHSISLLADSCPNFRRKCRSPSWT